MNSRSPFVAGLLFCPQVLPGPVDIFTEGFCGVQWKIRIPEGLSADQNQVGLTFLQDFFGLEGFGDQSHGPCQNTCFLFDAFGERYLIVRTRGNLCVRDQTT